MSTVIKKLYVKVTTSMTLYSTVGGSLMSFEPTCRTTAAGCVCVGAVGTNDRYLLTVLILA
jgi:hypothetical protein